MFNMRRAHKFQEPVHPAGAHGHHGWDDEEAMAELARLVDEDLQATVRRQNSPHDLVEALATEFDRDYGSMEPVDLDGSRSAGRRPQVYDAWDDDALQAYSDDLISFTESEPDRFEEGMLPPHSYDEERAAPAPRRRSGLMALAGLVVLAGVGGVAYGLIGGVGGIGEPQLVRAPEGPYKVIPDASEQAAETADASPVFSPREALPEKGEDRLVARPETVPDLPGVTVPGSRVILPNGDEVLPEAELVDAGPRRVRTVLVKPDGTIIESPDGPPPSLANRAAPAPAPADAAPGIDGDPMTTAGILPSPEQVDPIASLANAPAVPVATQPASMEPLPPLGAPTDTVAAAPTPVGEPLAQPPVAEAAPVQVTAPMPVRRPDVPRSAAPAEPAPQAAAPTQVATADPFASAAPAPAAAAPAPAAAAPAASGAAAYVQIASQRSEAAALSSFQALQKKFPSILGGVTPDVQRADLGDKGIYYRARVGKPTREAAVSLCEQLKAAGGDCLIARN
ncbi:SPOR domain-containing protein [Chthonobacter rhizosphaerae]|uniref:SPOR domain-containing protein n=1 Tax=Chthonobacter rhizosphaerae TaxID=2735553 RepID=UPI0015EEA396|nr:SPOR domain-containing protein [Chthonobacter rhizosphaerae]